jgi:hypothetical protein
MHNLNQPTSSPYIPASKGKDHPTTGHEGPEGGVVLYPYTFFNLGARCGGWSTPRSGRFTPGKTQYSLYRILGGTQGRSGWVWIFSPPPGFDPRTVQHVASRIPAQYT